MRHATYTTCKIYNATCDIRHAKYTTQHATRKIYNTQNIQRNMRHTIYDIRHAKYTTQHATYDMRNILIGDNLLNHGIIEVIVNHRCLRFVPFQLILKQLFFLNRVVMCLNLIYN